MFFTKGNPLKYMTQLKIFKPRWKKSYFLSFTEFLSYCITTPFFVFSRLIHTSFFLDSFPFWRQRVCFFTLDFPPYILALYGRDSICLYIAKRCCFPPRSWFWDDCFQKDQYASSGDVGDPYVFHASIGRFRRSPAAPRSRVSSFFGGGVVLVFFFMQAFLCFIAGICTSTVRSGAFWMENEEMKRNRNLQRITQRNETKQIASRTFINNRRRNRTEWRGIWVMAFQSREFAWENIVGLVWSVTNNIIMLFERKHGATMMKRNKK